MAVAEELLRDFSKLGPFGPCPLSRCSSFCSTQSFTCAPRLFAGVYPRTRLEPSKTDPPASVASGAQASTMAGLVEASQAHCPASMLWADMPRALHVGKFVRSGGPAVLASCPADRWRLPNSDSRVCAHGCRGRAGYLNCGLAPRALHT